MLNYLTYFFEKYSYQKEDSDFLLSVYKKIAADGSALDIWNKALGSYEESLECDYKQIVKDADKVAEILSIHEYTLELLIFMCMSRKMKEYYVEKGISEEIFDNTILDLRYNMDECKLIYGIVGTFTAPWHIEFFELKVFGLGRLQFEIDSFGKNYEKGEVKLTPESKVINIHIPRSLVPLTEESCKESYKMAKEFFKGQYDEPCAFICRSWLLYPENEKLFPKGSNTYKFFSSFEIISSSINKDNSNLWRLFDTLERNPAKLPADTSIRRAFVNHLLAGGKTGGGVGIFFG